MKPTVHIAAPVIKGVSQPIALCGETGWLLCVRSLNFPKATCRKCKEKDT